MNSLAIPLMLLTLILPPLVVKPYARKILREEIPDEEKLYKGIKVEVACILAGAISYIISTLFFGIADVVLKFVGDRIGNPYLGAVVFTAILIGPLLVSIVLTVLAASELEVKVKGIEAKTSKVIKDVLKLIIIVTLPGLVWFAIWAALPEGVKDNLLLIGGIFAVYILAFFALAPYWMMLLNKSRPLEEPLRSEILRFCEGLGVKVRDVRVTGKKGYKVANAGVTGILPWARYILITEYMLETFEPEEIKAIIAHEVGHIKGRHLWINAGVTIGWFAFWGGLVFILYRLFEHPSPAIVSAVFLFSYLFYTMFIEGKVSMRNEFKADEFAAEVVGKEVMIRTLEKLARTNLAPRRMGRAWKYLFMTYHPSIEERVNHLKGMSGA